jgi:hypothetical protein
MESIRNSSKRIGKIDREIDKLNKGISPGIAQMARDNQRRFEQTCFNSGGFLFEVEAIAAAKP